LGVSCGESRAPHECQIAAGLLDRWVVQWVVGWLGAV